MNILIHGFNVKDPMSTTGKLSGLINDSMMYNYGFFNLFNVLFENKSVAKDLAEKFPIGHNVIAHSNGCAIAVQAARMGMEIETLVCLNPALNVNLKFPKSIKRIYVIYTKHDRATRAARFFDSIPLIELVVPDIWGAMGTKGAGDYVNDTRIINIDQSHKLSGHSDIFSDDKVASYADSINKFL